MEADFLDSLLALTALDRLPRTGWLQAGVRAPESVAAHTAGVAWLTLALGPRVEPPLDSLRAAALALWHDAPEALTGDLPRSGSRHLPPGAKRAMERGAAEELLRPLEPVRSPAASDPVPSTLAADAAASRAGGAGAAEARAPSGEPLGALAPLSPLALWNEYDAGETREARFTRLCDTLHLGLVLLAGTRAGSRFPETFQRGLEATDASEFPVCDELRLRILAALDRLAPPNSGA